MLTEGNGDRKAAQRGRIFYFFGTMDFYVAFDVFYIRPLQGRGLLVVCISINIQPLRDCACNIWNNKWNPNDSHVNRYELMIKKRLPTGRIFFLLWRHGFRSTAFDVFTFNPFGVLVFLVLVYLSISNPVGLC